jgi:serine/threonine protein phosphatase PrpC/CRP-like cAMP-binding protein
MKHEVYGLTHQGQVRDHNEDTYLIDRELNLYIVCDGLGGHAAGEVASEMACKVIRDHIRLQKKAWANLSDSGLSKREWAISVIEGAIVVANRAIWQAAELDKSKQGMGCTVVLVMIVDQFAAIAHVGDSRVYLFRDDKLHRLTEDHSAIDEQFKRGEISLESALTASNRSGITRAVGARKEVESEILFISLMSRDRFLLCSDGLTLHVPSKELEYLVRNVESSRLPKYLIDLANDRGGGDNITEVSIEVAAADPRSDQEVANEFKVLKGIPLFKRFDTVELMKLISAAFTIQYKPGQNIIREGSENDRLHVCISGDVEVVKDGAVIAELGAGDFFGEMSMIDKHPSVADVNAKGRCHILVWGRKEFFELIERDRYLASRILWRLCLVLNDRSRHLINELSAIRKKLPAKPRSQEESAVAHALRNLAKSTY